MDPATERTGYLDSSVSQINLEAQGQVLAIAHAPRPRAEYAQCIQSGPEDFFWRSQESVEKWISGGKRGVIRGFSRASRGRMIKQIARIECETPIFITLTYPKNFPGPLEAKTHLFTLFKRFHRLHPGCSGIWKLEPQKRGAPHFHILMYNLPFLPFEQLREMWHQIIVRYVETGEQPRVRIEQIRSRRGVNRYASKYLAKPAEQSFFIQDAYLTAGRWWGVFNRAALPLAVRKYVSIQIKNERAFWDAKRAMRRIWKDFNRDRGSGGWLLTERAYSWFDAIQRILESEAL